jgi:hypothetical protein
MSIVLFDPSLRNNHGELNGNLGDIIITEAIRGELHRIFGDEEIISISSHSYPGEKELRKIGDARKRFVGGTNLLSSEMRVSRQWKFPTRSMAFRRTAILCGVGWRGYEGEIGAATMLLLHAILSKRCIHSVRDEYTKQKLASCGIKNVLNTSCPTLWALAGERRTINNRPPARNVLVMLTDYRQEPELDRQFLRCVEKCYDRIFLWPQGEGDVAYFRSLQTENRGNVCVLDESMVGLEECLSAITDLDYVGTRLHGGIKCMLAGKRSLIIEVDNRALEIAKSTGLPTIRRDDIRGLERWVRHGWTSDLHVDAGPIEMWREQFQTDRSNRSDEKCALRS